MIYATPKIIRCKEKIHRGDANCTIGMNCCGLFYNLNQAHKTVAAYNKNSNCGCACEVKEVQ